MRTILLVIGAVAVILLLALLLSQSSVDTIPYAVTGTSGEIEFRRYPEMVLATVDTAERMQGLSCSLPTYPAAIYPGKKSR